ncbi:TetR family transcriptional regulator [Rhodobacterales bacterium HKCCE3408]|nr:TetR family transcriptional regulator [Rhodobacterales bacterium HKCCE3408]
MIFIIGNVNRQLHRSRSGPKSEEIRMARSSREVATANRERVLEQAARLLRERGIEAAGVNDIMAAAGLTHGGFYRHFASKSDLVAEAVTRSLTESAREWREVSEAAPSEDRISGALERIVERYLSEAHRDAPGYGCALAALGAEAARLPPEARAQVASGAEAMVTALAEAMPGSDTTTTMTEDPQTGDATSISPEARDLAMATLSTLVGALLLARLGVGPDGGARVLEVARAKIMGEAERAVGGL